MSKGVDINSHIRSLRPFSADKAGDANVLMGARGWLMASDICMQTCLCMESDGSGDDELRISNSARPQEPGDATRG